MNFDFSNKTVLITGGSKGIGKEIRITFESYGANVISISSKDYDLVTKNGLKSLMDYISGLPNVDVLINNAGIIHTENINNLSFEQYDSLMHINLKAPFFIIQAVSQLMKKNNQGRIVNIASIAANRVREGRSVYSASKSALITMTKVASIELAPYNILVNSVSPGFTLTEMVEKNMSEKIKLNLISKVPLGKFADVKDIASMVTYLASSNNQHITGQDIIIDGGFSSSILL